MNNNCPACKLIVESLWYYCPNCGNSLKEKPPNLSISKQIVIYGVSFFLAPFGLAWGIKYARYSDKKTRIVGYVSIILTVISIIITVATVKYALDEYSKILNSISPYGL